LVHVHALFHTYRASHLSSAKGGMPMSRTKILLLLAVVVGGAGPVGAVDGVIEINQAKAMAGGLNGSLVSDPPGFPVSITQPGSYRLTGDLTVPDGNTTAISIPVIADVTLDLGGFAIRGPNLVNDNPACSAGGTGYGIVSDANPTVVRNGSVIGMGSEGIRVGGVNSKFEDVRVVHNCGAGIHVLNEGAMIVECHANRNRFQGYVVGEGGLVKDSVAWDNMGDGIFTEFFASGSSVLGCVVGRNRGVGITASSDTGIGHTTFYNNSLGAVTGGKNLDCNVINGVTFCP
jgi:hypothetical protein